MTTQPSTRHRILKESLNLFAEKGYESVRVAEIAEKVGIKAPSLYKHFKSKQGIFEALLAEMDQRYKAQMEAVQMDGKAPEKDAAKFDNVGQDQLLGTARTLFSYYLHDEFAAPFRRLLALEQFRNPQLAALFGSQYIEDPLNFQSALFQMLIEVGHFKPENASVMALQFYGPIYMLLAWCDCRPEMEAKALEMLEKHIEQFEHLYRLKKAVILEEEGS